MSYRLVKEAHPQANYEIKVRFDNGACGIFDCKPLLNDAFWSPIRDVDFFNRAHAECGTIVWDDAVDVAPETVWSNTNLINT